MSTKKEGASAKAPTPTVLNKADQKLWGRLHPKDKPKISNVLTRFARKHCGNFDSVEGLCSLGGFCKLAMNQPCRYFRENVFSICDPGYKFATETKLYSVLLNRYSKIDPRVVQREAVVRLCPDCNKTELLPRQRVCEKCAERRRSASYRKSRKKAG